MKKYLNFLLVIALCFSATDVFGQSDPAAGATPDNPQTCLFPVGGGRFTDDLLKAFLEHSPKDNPQVLIIPYAGREDRQQAAADRYIKRFNNVGAMDVQVLDLSNPQAALEQIRQSDVMWMTGGQQYRLRQALENANVGLPEAILQQYLSGGAIIGGTSAGAAIMSDVMIRRSRKDRVTGIQHPVLSYGLKLWPDIIVDQHFSERNRLDRLSIALEEHPHLFGIGIDEGTGVFYINQESIKVVGRGTVTVLSPPSQESDKKTRRKKRKQQHTRTVLEAGDMFNFKENRKI